MHRHILVLMVLLFLALFPSYVLAEDGYIGDDL